MDWSGIVSFGQGQSNNFVIGVNNQKLYISSSLAGFDTVVGPNLVSNTQYHIALTQTNSSPNNNKIIIYLNGDELNTNLATKFVFGSYDKLFLGVNSSRPYFYFSGYLADLRIYNDILTLDQVKNFSNIRTDIIK